jgi:multimeric flavodoxin WrbA
MMRILAIMGSPHQGNSSEIVQRIQEKLEAYGDVEFDYVHLKDVDLQPCRGCFVCFIKGEDRCPLKDDAAGIRQKMEQADGVILVSPVYAMHVTYLMKRFIDRFAYNLHRPQYFGKYAIVVAVTGNIGLGDTQKYLKNIARGWGFDCVDQLGYLAAPKNTPLRTISSQKDRTDEVVDKFHTAIEEKSPRRLSFEDHLWFRLMQASYARLETMSPTDYAHWKERGWLERDARFFHGNVRGNPVLDLVARFMGWMMGLQIDRALAETAQEPTQIG